MVGTFHKPAMAGLAYTLALTLLLACNPQAGQSGDRSLSSIMEDKTTMSEAKPGLQAATFGAGCFWCVEAVFERLKGVEEVVSGYAGGHVANPTYEAVCTGTTGHAEVCRISYDPKRISYAELLEVFWRTHDPTTRNRQGNDVGTQYRSVIFYHDVEQKRIAEELKAKLDAEHIWNRPIVTEIASLDKFWPAEDYHQNYYENNPEKGYCAVVITPKIEKFRQIFREKIK